MDQASTPFSLAAVLFDLDGTLIDSHDVTAAAIWETLTAFGRPLPPPAIAAAMSTGLPLRRVFVESAGLPSELVEDAYCAYVRTIIDRAALTRPMPAADELLDALRARAIPIAIVTTRLVEIARPLIAAAGWTSYFTLIVGQETAARPKPAPDPAHFALQALGVLPERACFVGDTAADMGCGSAAGLGVMIGVTGVADAETLRAAGATHVCSGLAEVQALLTVAFVAQLDVNG